MPRKTNTQSNNPQTGNESMEDVNYSIDDLLDKAQDAIETLQPELAEKFYLKAMQLEPQNTFIMDDYAALLLEIDQFDKAKELLMKSMKLEPNLNPGKYMQLGQLHQGQESLKYYNKGIELMEKEKKEAIRDKENDQVAFLKTQIANALCSCAEVFLTDECFADNAEEECERFLQKALKTDPKNPETLQTLASVRISQEKNEDALKLLTQSYDLWKDLHVTQKPSYEFRHNTAKLMMELDQPGHSADIWEDLIDEDDSIAEVHYHLGLAYSKLDKSSSLECLRKSKELLEKTGGEAELLAQVKQMIEDIKNDPTIPEYQSDGEGNAGNDDEEEDEEMMDEN